MSSNFGAIHAAVVEQTANFKTYFLSLAKKSAERDYDNLPNKREKLLKHLDDIYCKLREISATYLNDHGGIISMKLFNEAGPKQRPLWKEQHKYEDLIRLCDKQIGLGKDRFVSINVDKAESLFNAKVTGLADKLDKKGFDPHDLTFSDIGNDPKLFDVYISSGLNKVHARSILAAANSDCMVAHFRFIITNVRGA